MSFFSCRVSEGCRVMRGTCAGISVVGGLLAGCAPPCERPLIVAHRGGIFEAPENTLPAYESAMAHGADGVEIDARLTADGVLVSLHDATTGRTTDDARDRAVAEMTFAELQELDAGSWFDGAYEGTHVPTLDEVVDALGADALLLFDLKPGSAQAVLELIERRDIAAHSIVMSPRESDLMLFVREAPEVRRVLYLFDFDGFPENAARVSATWVRVPKDGGDEAQKREQPRVTSSGYRPAVSGRALVEWNGALVIANNVKKTVKRRDAAQPEQCR